MTSPSTGSSAEAPPRRGSLLPTPTIAIGLAVAILLIALFTYRSLHVREESVRRITQTMQVLQQLESAFSAVKDAETGQRGFLLTGEERYLEPYLDARAALPGRAPARCGACWTNKPQQLRSGTLDQLATAQLSEIEQTIALRRRRHSTP